MSFKSKIFADGLELLDSGFLQTEIHGDIKFQIGPPSDALNLIIKFETEDGKDKEVSTNLIEETKTLEITLINFNNALGSGWKKPIQIGQFQDQKLYFTIFVEATADTNFISYAFYTGGQDG